jgi:transposase
MRLLKFSRSFWETAVAYGGSKPNVLRDYDILVLHKQGKTCGEIAQRFNISCPAVMKIIHKYP